MDYLKSEQYYSDLYDLLTIKRCLDSIRSSSEVFSKDANKLTPKQVESFDQLYIYYLKGWRFKNKSEKINEWMSSDREKDEKVRNARAPSDIRCDYCSTEMNMTMKDLHWDFVRVMFWFECPSCKKRKAIFDNGEEYRSKPNLCPKCSCEVNEKLERKDRVLITYISCPNCRYRTKESIDFEKNDKEWADKQEKDTILLKKYKWKYCMSEKEGNEFVNTVTQLESLFNHLKEHEQKEADPIYQKAKLLKKLSIVELEKLLGGVLEREKYIKLNLDKPEMDKKIVVPFTVQDADTTRAEYESTRKLRKLIKNTLEDTNWRLMSEGTAYRLGYVYGRLKGYEREEDFMELVRKRDSV